MTERNSQSIIPEQHQAFPGRSPNEAALSKNVWDFQGGDGYNGLRGCDLGLFCSCRGWGWSCRVLAGIPGRDVQCFLCLNVHRAQVQFHHIGQCAEKRGIWKRRGHQARYCRILVPRAKQRSVVSGKKAEVICYGCGGLGHYKRNCPIVKFHKHVDKYSKGKARGESSAITSNERHIT
nr:hypothetical protein [Tanacetum cinerariifolium]